MGRIVSGVWVSASFKQNFPPSSVLRWQKRGVTIHFAATNHSEFITLVAGKRLSLLMAGNDEVYDKKLQRYAVVNLKPK